jgi:hypothetical protein
MLLLEAVGACIHENSKVTSRSLHQWIAVFADLPQERHSRSDVQIRIASGKAVKKIPEDVVRDVG